MGFFGRVLRSFSGRDVVSLSVRTDNSVRVSSRRAVRSIKVLLNRTFDSTVNSGGNVGEVTRTVIPVSRSMTAMTVSVDKHDCYGVSLGFGGRGVKSVASSVIVRFFRSFTNSTGLGVCNAIRNTGSRRGTRTVFGTFTGSVGRTVGVRRSRVPSAGNML